MWEKIAHDVISPAYPNISNVIHNFHTPHLPFLSFGCCWFISNYGHTQMEQGPHILLKENVAILNDQNVYIMYMLVR